MFGNIIEKIEKDLSQLALFMLNLKSGENIKEREFINFQVKLAESLYNAMSLYREISQKEQQYIEKKESIDKTDFLEKMKKWKVSAK